ncbi:hypothetical protein CTI12_AA256510 [Artemisia annua]|uniref:VQ domain-containing protein n=1 Tax=Artemisia annua TaxID=35608 RepID=A0A2U1NDV7_ARTAN|nr:hypothetical protein CTI12_AA256510 [Artemisia annua]
MGKQMSKASIKISKNNNHHQSLKPKVYITHSSSFKTLVQELTGKNGTAVSLTNSAVSLPQEAGTHGLKINKRDQLTNDCKGDNSQNGTLFLDDPSLMALSYTECLSFVPESSNQIDPLDFLFD